MIITLSVNSHKKIHHGMMDPQIPRKTYAKAPFQRILPLYFQDWVRRLVPSLLNAYSFIKVAVFRRLTFFFKYKKCPDILELLERAKDFENYPHLKTMEGFFREAREINSEVADSAKKTLLGITPFVVVNRVRTGKDANTGKVIQGLMENYLGIKSSELMTIREDIAVGKAIARMKPVMSEAPGSPFSRDIEEIALKLCE